MQVPAELASRSSSDATTTALLVRGDENGDNSSNNGKGASKRSASAVEATPGTKSDKSDPKEVAEAVTKDTFALIGKIALGVLIPVIICVVVVVWYKHHKKGVKKELENLKSMRQKGWYGSDGSFTTSKYRSRRMV